MKKYNKILIISSVIIILLVIVGITFAYYRWSSSEGQKANVKLTIGENIIVTFERGNDVSGTLYPTLTNEEGIIKTVSVSATNEGSTFSLWLKIEDLPDELKDGSFIWEVWKNDEMFDAYDFTEESILDYSNNGTTDLRLVLNEPVGTDIDTYTIYFWINGNIDNDISMGGKSFDFELYATGGNANAIFPQYLSNFISAKYNNAEKTNVTSNNVTYNYATSVSLMNDRLGSMETAIDNGNIRYYGATPSNYIYFNCNDYNIQTEETCELWRIVGVFDGKVKIMKNASIGVFSFDTSARSVNRGQGVNEWSQADLMKLLNPGYEENYDLNNSGNSILVNNSLYWQGPDGQAGNCYNAATNGTTTCDFRSTGLKNNTTRSMISTSTYYLGTLPSNYESSSTMNEIYIAERSGLRLDSSTAAMCLSTPQYCTDTVERTGTWRGKIALLYLSDYGYASDLNLCKNKTNDNYGDNACSTNNWIYYTANNLPFHLISPADLFSKLSSSAIITKNNIFGVIGDSSSRAAFNTYITLYLNPDILLIDGNGSSKQPYMINLNN